MSRNGRLAVLAAVVVAAVAGFAIAKPGDDDGSDSTTTTTGSERQTETEPTRTTQQRPRPVRIDVRGGQPAGGARSIEVERGEVVRIVVAGDTGDEVHVHGYDVTRDFAPGRPARIRFRATIEGAFEVELHGSGAKLATLTVSPS